MSRYGCFGACHDRRHKHAQDDAQENVESQHQGVTIVFHLFADL